MKYIKIITTAVLTAALMLTATSCQLSKLMPQKTESADSTTAPLETFPLPGSTTAAGSMDLKNEDLTKYVTVGNYKGLTVDETVTPITDEAFETQLTAYLNSATVYEEITDRATAEGDTIVMDYVGTLDGVAFAGGTAQGQTIELSSNSGYIEGFAEGLIGVTPGSTVALDLTFPADYHATDLAGKAVVFTVTVHHIRGEKIAPEATDAFITKFTDGEFTTVDAFRAYYRDYLEMTAAEKAYANALNTLWAQVYENSTFHSVPAQQIDYYHAQLKAQYESYAAAYGMTYESILSAFGLTDAGLRTQAEEIAKQDLVFFSLVQAEKLTVTDEEYAAGLAEYAAGAGVSTAEIEAYYGKDRLVDSILWEEMLEMIYSYATVTK